MGAKVEKWHTMMHWWYGGMSDTWKSRRMFDVLFALRNMDQKGILVFFGNVGTKEISITISYW